MLVNRDIFDTLAQWQQGKKGRTVDITLGDVAAKDYDDKVWVYDYEYQEGLHLEDIKQLETLDLLQKKRDGLIKQLASFE